MVVFDGCWSYKAAMLLDLLNAHPLRDPFALGVGVIIGLLIGFSMGVSIVYLIQFDRTERAVKKAERAAENDNPGSH